MRSGPTPAVLTHSVSSTCISYFTSHTLLTRELARIRSIARLRALPQAPDGTGPILPDITAVGEIHKDEKPKTDVERELERLGREKERTRWAKGRGLDGEVEEEGEMRDTFFRPGVPRREV